MWPEWTQKYLVGRVGIEPTIIGLKVSLKFR